MKATGKTLDEVLEFLAAESGLLGLDWHNGNRTVLVDQRLTGALLGMTLIPLLLWLVVILTTMRRQWSGRLLSAG